MKFWKAFAAFIVLSAPAAVQAVVIVETFESFASGTIITNQLTGLTVTALNGGNANIATASSPVVPGQPQGIYNDWPGVFSSGFEFPLVFDFNTAGSSIGAIVDFGAIGAGLIITAYDGPGGTGNILGSATTTTEIFIGVAANGIRSAIFQNVNPASPASWLLDNLTYDTSAARVPEPTTLLLLGLGLAGLGFARKRLH